jgi:hypothetical protein
LGLALPGVLWLPLPPALLGRLMLRQLDWRWLYRLCRQRRQVRNRSHRRQTLCDPVEGCSPERLASQFIGWRQQQVVDLFGELLGVWCPEYQLHLATTEKH